LSEIETHTIDPSAASPGAILKRCREYHEISLEEAEEATKIGANYLQALEEDQIGQFASVAYLKGFLRIYTTYLGLNPDDMIRLYDKLYNPGGPQSEHKKNTSDPGEPDPRKKFPLQKLMMPAVLLMLIILASAIVNRSPSTPLRQNQPAPVAAPITVPSIQPVLSSAKQAPPIKKPSEVLVDQKRIDSLPNAQNRIQTLPLENAKGFIVRMKVNQSGSLTVNIDGSTSQVYDLVIGDSIEWKADRIITLELSNSGGVEVELNGRQLKPFGQPGKPAVVVLDTDGIRP
jgi:cytoskeletal protein RodZ